MAEFTDSPPTARPKTVPPNRPIVPSPYFFKYYSNAPYSKYPGSASAKSNRKPYPPSSQFESKYPSNGGEGERCFMFDTSMLTNLKQTWCSWRKILQLEIWLLVSN